MCIMHIHMCILYIYIIISCVYLYIYIMYINTSHYSHDVASPTLQHPKGMFLKGFSRLRKYSTICRKNNDSGENCRLGHLPKMPKVTIFCLSQESDAKRKDKNRYECQPAFLRSSRKQSSHCKCVLLI